MVNVARLVAWLDTTGRGLLVVGKQPFTADQIEFVNIIVDHLTERGAMDPAVLYENPFIDHDPLGVAGLFDEADVVQLIDILNVVSGCLSNGSAITAPSGVKDVTTAAFYRAVSYTYVNSYPYRLSEVPPK